MSALQSDVLASMQRMAKRAYVPMVDFWAPERGEQCYQSPAERERSATAVMTTLERIHAIWKAVPRFQAPLRELIAWAAMGQDLERGIRVWRIERCRARKAARSAVAMGQGRPAFAVPQDAAHAVFPAVKTPSTRTAVVFSSEAGL